MNEREGRKSNRHIIHQYQVTVPATLFWVWAGRMIQEFIPCGDLVIVILWCHRNSCFNLNLCFAYYCWHGYLDILKKISQYIHLPGCSFWGLHIIFYNTDMTSLSNVLMEWGTCTWSEGPFPFSKYVFSLGKRNGSVGVILFVMVFLFMLRLGDSWRIHPRCQVY